MHSQESTNPFFHIFQRRRLKVNEMHRQRREQLFNKSRRIFQQGQNENQSKSILSTCQKQPNPLNMNQFEGQSSLNIQNSQENFFQMEQNQIKVSLQSISISQDTEQQPNRKTSYQGTIQNQLTKVKENKQKIYSKSSNKYAKTIQIPSWMNTVPEQLHNFYCMARPNGKMGLLVFTESWMKIYDKFGKYITIQKISQNPKLNQIQIKKVCKHFEGTTLQISYNQQTKTIHITDVLFWKNSVMTTQNFQFRYAWLMANLAPLINANTGLKIYLAQYLPLTTQQNLKKLYCENFGYEKQGLLFIHKQSPYIHGYNQNVLIWKDANTSKYPVVQGNSKFIYGIGKLVKNGTVYTLDGYKLGHIDPNCLPGIKNGYIKYRITGVSFRNVQKVSQTQMTEQKLQNHGQNGDNSDINLSLQNFQVVQYKKYGKAEPLSRIMFQYRIRHDPLTIQQIASRIIRN